MEHAIGRLRRLGIRQARYFGAKKVAMQLAMIAMAANLGLLALCRGYQRLIRPPRLCYAKMTESSGRDAGYSRTQRLWPELALCRPDL